MILRQAQDRRSSTKLGARHVRVLRVLALYSGPGEVDMNCLAERLGISRQSVDNLMTECLVLGMVVRLRRCVYELTPLALEALEKAPPTPTARPPKMSLCVLDALKPFADAGRRYDVAAIAEALACKASTVRTHISRLIAAKLLFRVGHHRLSLKAPDRATEQPVASPDLPAARPMESFIRPLTNQEKMRRRA